MDQAVAQLGAFEAQDIAGQPIDLNVELLGEQEFLREALETSSGKVRLGQLAQQRSQSDDVKQFSKQMTQDYGDLSDRVIKRVAKRLEVPDSKGLSKKDKQLAASLQELAGPQFDDLYIRLMMKSYEQDLKRSSSEAALAQYPGVKVTVELETSIVSQHLKMLEQIVERHNAVAANQNPLPQGHR